MITPRNEIYYPNRGKERLYKFIGGQTPYTEKGFKEVVGYIMDTSAKTVFALTVLLGAYAETTSFITVLQRQHVNPVRNNGNSLIQPTQLEKTIKQFEIGLSP
ncbi:hypothetical protein HYX03_02730 [Candidatus Woesearchaeota archaeon]|nr:hypothetical protein [Candidatus Woesearchaeota archaeon]